jgi:serine/threonine-protein kinase RsbW
LKNTHQISRAAELQSLPDFREFIDTVCQGCTEANDQFIYDLKLAVDEACTNIITHGYAGMNPGSILLTLDLEPRQVKIVLTDFGHSFEPSEPPAPDVGAAFEDRPAGGFGLFFIYQCMDGIDYDASECGNHLTLIKKLRPLVCKPPKVSIE